MSLIEFSDVSLVRDGKELLRSVDWTIKRGERWILFGKNGSGKTLILQLLSGYLHASSGSVARFGFEYGADLRELRKRIGFVGDFVKKSISPWLKVEDVILGGKFASIGLFNRVDKEDRKRADKLMKMLSCEQLQDRKMEFLSAGERERVLIARSLMPIPDILVLDEPCAGLDISAREHFLKNLAEIESQHPDMAIVFVTHRPDEILPLFNKILMIKDGGVFASGNLHELFESETVSKAMDVKIEIKREFGRFWAMVKD